MYFLLTCSISQGSTANCRSLERNKYVCMYVSNKTLELDILCITEHWLDER